MQYCSTKIPNFCIHGHCKIDLYSSAISWKNSCEMSFKKIIYFKWTCNFVQNWFRIDTKMMQNFVHKKSFRSKPRNCRKRINCFVETLDLLWEMGMALYNYKYGRIITFRVKYICNSGLTRATGIWFKFNLNSITFNLIILKLYELNIFKNQSNYDIFLYYV